MAMSGTACPRPLPREKKSTGVLPVGLFRPFPSTAGEPVMPPAPADPGAPGSEVGIDRRLFRRSWKKAPFGCQVFMPSRHARTLAAV